MKSIALYFGSIISLFPTDKIYRKMIVVKYLSWFFFIWLMNNLWLGGEYQRLKLLRLNGFSKSTPLEF